MSCHGTEALCENNVGYFILVQNYGLLLLFQDTTLENTKEHVSYENMLFATPRVYTEKACFPIPYSQRKKKERSVKALEQL